MSDYTLFEASAAGDRAAVAQLIDAGAPVNAADEQGWSALSWAAGQGRVAIVELLLTRGADPLHTGRDERRPYDIALAAGHAEAARLLREAEAQAGGADRPLRPYCKAYLLRDLRRFPAWEERSGTGDGAGNEPLTDESVVFVHQDFTVTRSIWHGEDVLFDAVSQEWAAFCEEHLAFAPPDDLDLVAR